MTGCYDWFHSGHVRFFEEVAELGRPARGRRPRRQHPAPQGRGPSAAPAGRAAIHGRFDPFSSGGAYVSSGDGWLDAQPEIERIGPDIYAVNEDGDRPEKT